MSTQNSNGWIHGGKYVKSSTPPRRFPRVKSPARPLREHKSSDESQFAAIVWTQLQRLIRFAIPLLKCLVETMIAFVVTVAGTIICGINHALTMIRRKRATTTAGTCHPSSGNKSITHQSSTTPSISNKTPSPSSSVSAVTTKQSKSQPVSALRKTPATNTTTTTPRRVLFSETEQGQLSVNKIHYDKHFPASYSATKIVRAGNVDSGEDVGTPVPGDVPRVNFNSPTVSFATSESPAPLSTFSPQQVTMQQVRVPPLQLPQQTIPVMNSTIQITHAPTIRPMHNHKSPSLISALNNTVAPSDNKSNAALQSNNYNYQKAKRKRRELMAAYRLNRTRPRLNPHPTNITRNHLKRKEIDEWVWNAMNDDGTKSEENAGDGSKENKFKAVMTPLKTR